MLYFTQDFVFKLNMFFQLCSVIVLLAFVTSSSSRPALEPPILFEDGDIVYCRKNWEEALQQGLIHALYTHVLLATNRTHVAHVIGHSDNQGTIIEEDFKSYLERDDLDVSNCTVTGESGHVTDLVERARQDIAHYKGQTVYYDPKACNSEHWYPMFLLPQLGTN